VPVVVTAAAAVAAGGGASTAAGCTFTVAPPTLYAPPNGIVLSNVSVECADTQRRIRIGAKLTRDGMVVADTRRDCRKAQRCYVDVDASANDVPGDQVWCTSASASTDGAAFAEETACETESF
jgi:hypothetical protein